MDRLYFKWPRVTGSGWDVYKISGNTFNQTKDLVVLPNEIFLALEFKRNQIPHTTLVSRDSRPKGSVIGAVYVFDSGDNLCRLENGWHNTAELFRAAAMVNVPFSALLTQTEYAKMLDGDFKSFRKFLHDRRTSQHLKLIEYLRNLGGPALVFTPYADRQ